MSYIENVYICIAAPLLIAVLCLRESRRRMVLFLLGGMTACLLSAYVSSFLAAVKGADAVSASLEIAPLVEECMKLTPVLFYLLVFEPEDRAATSCALLVAVGFATLENVCYLTQNGAGDALHLLIRGFGTGAMHVVCGAMVSLGLLFLWDRLWIRVSGTVGLLALAVTYHGVYNLLVTQEGAASIVGYVIPLLTAALVVFHRFSRRRASQEADC